MNETEQRALTLAVAAAQQISRSAEGYGLARVIVAGAVSRHVRILSHGGVWRLFSEEACTIAYRATALMLMIAAARQSSRFARPTSM